MTKAELAFAIAEGTKLREDDVLKMLNELPRVITETLKAGENVYIRGFGAFQVKKKAEKTARHISAGKQIKIAAHFAPAFKAYPEFKNSLKPCPVLK